MVDPPPRPFARATVRMPHARVPEKPANAPAARRAAPADARIALHNATEAVRVAVTSASGVAVGTQDARRPASGARPSTLAPIFEINTAIRMSSVALGLDTTSAEAPSRLSSTASIGIDGTTPQAASVLASSANLGLDVTSPERASSLTSTAEANTMRTSYGVVEARFSAGTSKGTLSGTYAGKGAAANATSLTLTVTSDSGTIGFIPKIVAINVKDQNNTNLGTHLGLIVAGGTMSLGSDIGLSITFSAGTLTENATSTFAVSNTTPTDVDANAAFNADINVRPRFEGNKVVRAGSFTVNGTHVSVLANDSINTVLARINSTVPGIVASFTGDKVTMRSTAWSEDNITLGSDTSGFLSALNLTSATTVKGNVRDDRQVLSKTTQFGAVSSGAFTVNGVEISVNRTTDSLESILNRINSASAGVSATYDAAADKVRLTTTTYSESDIVVAGDTSGFLTAGKLTTGNTVRGNIHDDKQILANVSRFAGVTAGSFTINGVTIAVNAAVDTLQGLLATINASAAGVSAIYDPGANTVTLTTKTNSEDAIVVRQDTTGLVAALKLNGATTARGNVADDRQVMAKTTSFAQVKTGSFLLNGRSIAVDAARDSLQSVIGRINAAGAGVTASYDPVADRLVFTPATPATKLVIEQDTSGFLEATSVATGLQYVRVNPAAAFNGTGNNAPQFDVGLRVGAGSFKVNGVRIDVAATDTLNAVLERITASAADVTASYDAATDRVRVVAKQMNAVPIIVGDDTSGFLAAVKLDGTHLSTRGQPLDDRTAAAVLAPLETAVTDRVVSAVSQLSEMLHGDASDTISEYLRTSIVKSIRAAAAAGSNGPPNGVGIEVVDGEEILVVDRAALAETLANDPHALDALVSGARGLPEALSVALAAETKAMIKDAPDLLPIATGPQVADIVRAVAAALTLRTMQRVGSSPFAHRRSLDLLA